MIWRALSIRQPWAWLIVNGHKDVENRGRSLKYRGPLLIHASQRMTEADYDACMIFVGGISCLQLPPPGSLDRGGIVGSVNMTGCVTQSESKWFCGPYGYLFNDAKPVPFFRCNGSLSLFSVDLPDSPACHPEPARPELVERVEGSPPVGRAGPARRSDPPFGVESSVLNVQSSGVSSVRCGKCLNEAEALPTSFAKHAIGCPKRSAA